MTGFAGAAALEDDALADALDAEDDEDALEALPEPLLQAAMNNANSAANTAATTALNLMLPFIVPLPFNPHGNKLKRCDPLHRFVAFHFIS